MAVENVNCKICEHFNKELGCCDASPSQLESQICLLRHIAFVTGLIYDELLNDSIDDGEDWKFK